MSPASVEHVACRYYAYILGTLFQSLVRTDENTVNFKALIKASDQFAMERKLPIALAGKIREYLRFQHSKQVCTWSVSVRELLLCACVHPPLLSTSSRATPARVASVSPLRGPIPRRAIGSVHPAFSSPPSHVAPPPLAA
jgi:hypothetical protein